MSQIQDQLEELVRSTVKEILNKLLDAEPGQLCNAARYERTKAQQDTRASHYKRKKGHSNRCYIYL